jgi:AcrR family transcriptional regulator
MSSTESLRERKKRATRQAISDIATSLFIERGFDQVTVEEIAEAANVSRMTVFNYFPRKEDLFFDREEEGRSLIQTALSDRLRSQSPIAALRNLVYQLVEQKHPFAKFDSGVASFWRTVKQSVALSARAREMRDELIGELAIAMAGSMGRPHSDPEAYLAAAMLITSWTVAYAEALRRRGGNRNNESTKVFLSLVERGFKGVAASMKGTPYV